MSSIYDLFGEPLNNLVKVGAPSWLMVGLGLVMFGAWSATYVFTIRKSSRDRAYGIPFPNTCFNFSWEFIFSFNLMGGLPKFFFPLQVGHLLWLIPNSFNLYQTLKYGPALQKDEWVRRHFKTIFFGTLAICFTLLYTYHQYTNDVFGVASSWMINVLMSWLFIRMLLERRDLIAEDGTIRGLSIKAAWSKLIGNAAGAVFCFYWWPAQFTNGVLMHNGLTIIEPPSWTFLYVLYGFNIALDIMLIRLLRKRELEIRNMKASSIPSGIAAV